MLVYIVTPPLTFTAMPETHDNAFKRLIEEGKKYLTLQIDYAKLTATEKISVILGMSVLFLLILVVGV